MRKLLECKIHGECSHRLNSDGKGKPKKWQCLTCISLRQKNLRKRRKETLVQMVGGRCILCGYNKWIFAIDFHHLDPKQKSFEIGKAHLYKFSSCVEELKKCVPLCRNCHAEFETGCPETIAKLEAVVHEADNG